jgi:hypothetical protein
MSHQLWTTLIKYNVSPNQIYFLDCCRNRIKPTAIINQEAEANICRAKGFINDQGQLTERALLILDEFQTFLLKSKKKVTSEVLGDQFLDKIKYYRELFPRGTLPSGAVSKQSVAQLKDKFIKFFQTYPEYEWPIVHLATEYYIFEKEKVNFEFMKNSGYFIDKFGVSELANYCDLLLESPEILEPALKQYKIQNAKWFQEKP